MIELLGKDHTDKDPDYAVTFVGGGLQQTFCYISDTDISEDIIQKVIDRQPVHLSDGRSKFVYIPGKEGVITVRTLDFKTHKKEQLTMHYEQSQRGRH